MAAGARGREGRAAGDGAAGGAGRPPEQAQADTGTSAKAVRRAALDALLRHVLDRPPQAVADEGNLTLGYRIPSRCTGLSPVVKRFRVVLRP